jgi:PIN domain nuclease of toxin-antitoxin system
LWLLFRPELLTTQTRQALESNEVYTSIASVWELAIKHKKGKLSYGPEKITEGIREAGLKLLSCEPNHVIAYSKITAPNNDPFDTMLLAQSVAENMPLLTADHEILDSKYNLIDARK